MSLCTPLALACGVPVLAKAQKGELHTQLPGMRAFSQSWLARVIGYLCKKKMGDGSCSRGLIHPVVSSSDPFEDRGRYGPENHALANGYRGGAWVLPRMSGA